MDKQETIHNNKFAQNHQFAGVWGAHCSHTVEDETAYCTLSIVCSSLLQQHVATLCTWAVQSILPKLLKKRSYFLHSVNGQHKSYVLKDRAAIEPDHPLPAVQALSYV